MGLSPAVILYDGDGNPVSIVSDSGVRRLSSISKILNASGSQVNPSTEDTLALAKGVLDTVYTRQGDGNQRSKITDGSNNAAVKNSAPSGTDYGLVVRVANPGGGVGADVNLIGWFGAATPTVGQKAMAASIPVTISSNQSRVPVTSSPADSTPGIAAGYIATSALTAVPIRATTYNEQSSNAQRSIASSSVSDTAAGTGARTVRITYYTATWTGPFTENITLNGVTPVNTVNTNICYIEKIEVVIVGSAGSNVGTITLFVSTGGGGGTIGTIAATDNRTFWAHHYIPTGVNCFVTSMDGHNNNNANGTIISLRSRSSAANSPWIVQGAFLKVGGSAAHETRLYGTAVEIAGPAALVLYGAPETGGAVVSRGSFDYYEMAA